MNITGHQQWEGKLLADLPVDYKRVTITRVMNATRTSCSQSIHITVVKDTPLVENKVRLELPLIITTKPRSPPEDKKQLISLRKDTVVTTPPSPIVKHKESSGSPTKQEKPEKTKKKSHKHSPVDPASILDPAKPVPDLLVEFNTPIPKQKTVPKIGVMSGFTTSYNPWNNPAGPIWNNPNPTLTGPTNPFGNITLPNELSHPFTNNVATNITPSLVYYPIDKNPFL